MKWETLSGDGFLLVRVTERALVRSPDWQELEPAGDSSPALIVLDLAQAEFISSLFWEGCAAWDRSLSRSGRRLALLNVNETQRRMLNLVGGLDRVPILSGRDELQDYVRGEGELKDSGVTDVEKRMLWSTDHGRRILNGPSS